MTSALKKIHEYLVQLSLKSGGTKDHFRLVKKSAWYRPLLKGLLS
jgi:hypothetical protein